MLQLTHIVFEIYINNVEHITSHYRNPKENINIFAQNINRLMRSLQYLPSR